MTDTSAYKEKLLDYLNLTTDVQTSKTPPLLSCPNPLHNDEHPSAVVYQKSRGDQSDTVYCPVCGESWDVFDVAAMQTGLSNFAEIKKYVVEKLGGTVYTKKMPQPKKIEKKPTTLTPLDVAKAKTIYSRTAVQSLADRMQGGKGVGKLVKVWPYKNKDGKVVLIDARFENQKGKSVISIYYNGKTLQSSGYPICVYNEDELSKSLPVIIHEGAKAAEAGKIALPECTHITWNGGAKKVKQIDWSSILTGSTVYLLPDDDHKTDRDGVELPKDKQPGYSAMLHIYQQLKPVTKVKMLPPYTPAREIKPDGADMADIVEVATPEEIKSFIETSENDVPDPPKPKTQNPEQDEQEYEDGLPYRVLGVADDGKAYFIGRHNRLVSAALDKLTKGKLLQLAGLDFWKMEYATGKDMSASSWDSATDDVIEMSNKKDFDPDNLRGRGAWRERDGSICYHDGKETIGEYWPDKMFMRKTQADIGIKDHPLDNATCKEIAAVCSEMSFESFSDAMRCLAWSVLSPFSGALPIRPAGLLTGPSGSGKTAILDAIIRPIGKPLAANAMESSVAGIRQKINNDSCGVALEEAEGGSDEKNKHRNDFFSLMRVSFSDDAPDAYKGTQDQSGRTFKMKNMFLFISIASEVEEVADDKRIFRINLKPKHTKQEWIEINERAKKIITEDNCRRLRAKTWQMLPEIIDAAEKISIHISEYTGLDSRTATSEAMLYAAYKLIFDCEELTESKIKEEIKTTYQFQPVEEGRDETDEIIERILDEVIMIPNTRGEKDTIRNILSYIKSGNVPCRDNNDIREYIPATTTDMRTLKNLVESYGVGYNTEHSALMIANNHHIVKKIIGRGNGYHRQLWRHQNFLPGEDGNKSKNGYIGGKTRRCTFIKGVIPEIGDDLPI